MTKDQYVELLEVRLLLHEERLLERLMADFSKFDAALADLTAKQAAAFADLEAKIGKTSAEDPAIQTAIDAGTAQVEILAAQPNDQPAIDAAATVVEAADAKVVAATPAPPAA